MPLAQEFEEIRKNILRQNTGPKYYNADLQLHTPYVGWDWNGSNSDTADDIVNKAKEKNLDIIAVTDHNWVGSHEKVVEAAKRLAPTMLVLAGVEFTYRDASGTKIHILAILHGNARAKIESILNKGGIEFDTIDESKGKKPIDRLALPVLIEEIANVGGICIAAHIDEKNGVRKEMKDYNKEALIELLKKPQLSAIQIKKSSDAKYYDGTDENIQNVKKTCVKTSDSHDLNTIGKVYTRFKMEDLDFESLKKAIKDRETRVRFDDELLPSKYHKILGMHINGNYFKDLSIAFNSSLNCFVGGKGTGKTALIELLRYALQTHIPSSKEQHIRESIGFWLGGGGTVSVLIESADGKQYLVTRTFGQPSSTILDMDGRQVQIDMNAGENFGIDIKGWNEIENTAVDSSEQLSLLDSFDEMKKIDDNFTRINSLRSQIRHAFFQIISLKEKKRILESEVAKLRDKQEKLQTIDQFNLKTLQKDFETIVKEKKLLETLDNSVTNEKIEIQSKSFKGLSDTVLEIKGRIPSEVNIAKTELESIVAESERVLNDLAGTRSKVQEQLSSLKKTIEETRIQVGQKHAALEESYRKELSGLSSDLQIEAKRREQLIIEVASLPERQRLLTETDLQVEENNQFMIKNLREFQKCLDEISVTRTHIAKMLSDDIGSEVRITIKPHGNHLDLVLAKGKINQAIQQMYPDLMQIFDKDKPHEIYAAMYRKDTNAIAAATGISEDRIKNFLDIIMNDQNFVEVMNAKPEDLPIIELQLKGSGEYRTVDRLSSGQRCTAILPIILNQSKRPLVIDQPEDNLDNAYIFSVVVNALRRSKEKQQIFVTTHNPNIVVSGDAEMVFVMQSDGMKGTVAHRGYVDSPEITKHILAVLEGGEEAFLIRKQKYGV